MRPFDISSIRQDFPNLNVQVNDKPLVYLDNGASTFKPQSVIDAITHHYTSETSNVHRGVHFLSEKATLAYEGVRPKVQAFLNAKHENEVIFTKGTTESINLVASSYGRKFLNEGDEILITAMEHHANIVPWQMLCEEKGCVLKIIPITDEGEIIWDEFEALLSEKTKFVAVVHISNTLGTINPVKEIIEEAHKVGAKVLIDGAQSVSHDAIDVQELDCDFFAFSGHKLFGPTGVGVLYGKQSLLDAMPPYQGGGDMIEHVTFEKTTYNALPYKFEAGTPHIAGVIGLGAAIDYMSQFDFADIEHHKAQMAEKGYQKLKAIEGLNVIGIAKNKTAILSFDLEGVHAHDLGTLLNEEGVAVRTGHHCTEPLMKRFGLTATTRASLSIYNTEEELDVLVSALNNAKSILLPS